PLREEGPGALCCHANAKTRRNGIEYESVLAPALDLQRGNEAVGEFWHLPPPASGPHTDPAIRSATGPHGGLWPLSNQRVLINTRGMAGYRCAWRSMARTCLLLRIWGLGVR